jgi:predicted RNase H-like HicB family nuclease
MRFELVASLRELGQALCATVAGGCGRAEALEELREVLFELVEDLGELGPC